MLSTHLYTLFTRRSFRFFIFFCLLIVISITWLTINEIQPFPSSLSLANADVRKVQLLDKNGVPLVITYQNDWNLNDIVPLHKIPQILQQIFILSEDKRFYEHHGADWQARWHATAQNLKLGRVVRGASTMTEQVVRMLHPRPRTFWSRWVEGFEAANLEKQFSKTDILEFYLNQIPYASQRRGVVQAARHYFDRDLDTLNLKEMMALSVLVRSPSRLDLRRGTREIEKPLTVLAQRLLEQGIISKIEYQTALATPLELHQPPLPIQAPHFVQHIYTSQPVDKLQNRGRLYTTIDASIQTSIQTLLDQRLSDLKKQRVSNGAVLVVDNQTANVLAWVNSGISSPNVPISFIDTVITPRQPGSTLKPLLYAMALAKGWTAATLIDDSPLAESVGAGLHNYRNYSRSHYGLLRLRDALGNSLNIPAIRTVQFVGANNFLKQLHELGMQSLTANTDFYGDGLALGNGAVTLFELVQAYTTLANNGIYRPLQVLRNNDSVSQRTVFTPEVTHLIGNILSDSDARRLEFGRGALLRFPVQTAVKTGTSTDYRDAWAIGFNHRYTVGVWFGNLTEEPMSEVSGSTGPALALRAIFAELNRYTDTQALPLSPRLVKMDICRETGLQADGHCPSRTEWFVAGTEPATEPPQWVNAPINNIRLQQPNDGLQLALDPRIPDDKEAFAFTLASPLPEGTQIDWLVNGEVVGTSAVTTPRYLWQVQRGTFVAQARLWTNEGDNPLETPAVTFYVK
ncbi:transglycosylase domain-containing protein [Beggiatoa leptomitoformis]|uniref:peptidoglycan glycosyltransferase n=1 Tax=Beggiatoa leptomitoformis TaxID=288004 RepID=A0A2N9YFK3_9GAMM|nr:transglycosylase domain-containing protein [Beggiatoa leptomitoformis]ALG68413.1 penicillin-binding protein 1C [Beggiatoa leptomitoformis]AUI69260.1 penicillin-binding protein 1C [Beggiatoa leptomitoformis]